MKRFVTHEQVDAARKVGLLEYLRSAEPDQLVRCGADEYCTKEHDSLKISNGKWYWWSRGIGGVGALDYLIAVKGMDFISAVEAVTRQAGLQTEHPSFSFAPEKKAERKLVLPMFTYRCDTAKKYLMARGIDGRIVDDFIARKMVAEDTHDHSVLFFGLDENGEIRQCSSRATDGSSAKKDVFGSDRSFCFFAKAETECHTLRVFESAIDLMSYATLMARSGLDYRTENMMSLSGIYLPGRDISLCRTPASLQRILDSNPKIKTVYLNLDNDFAGRRGAAGLQFSLKDRYDTQFIPPPQGKDYNDYLILLNQELSTKQEKERHKTNEKDQSR